MASTSREHALRGAGLILSTAGCAILVWVFVHQPTSLQELTGGVAATVGAYQIDQAAFEQGRQFFEADKFVEARAAFARADPASRHAPTQFFIAYSFYRQGWGRLYSDDALFAEGLDAVNRAIALAPDGRVSVEEAGVTMTSDELKAELQQGLTRDASDFNPMRVLRQRR